MSEKFCQVKISIPHSKIGIIKARTCLQDSGGTRDGMRQGGKSFKFSGQRGEKKLSAKGVFDLIVYDQEESLSYGNQILFAQLHIAE